MEYKALFYIAEAMPQPHKLREVLDEMQLSYLATAESLVAKAIRKGIQEQTHYKEIYTLCKKEIEHFVLLVGTTEIPQESLIGHNAYARLE